jgi:hypothetical protein
MQETINQLPPHLLKIAPKAENFPSKEAYEEAKAFFIHRVRRTIRAPLRASPQK